MKNNFIEAKPLMTQKDWEKLMTMSEEEIEKNAQDDLDNPPFGASGSYISTMLRPDGIIIHSLAVEQKIENWLKEHNLQAEVVASALLKQFVEAQVGMNTETK